MSTAHARNVRTVFADPPPSPAPRIPPAPRYGTGILGRSLGQVRSWVGALRAPLARQAYFASPAAKTSIKRMDALRGSQLGATGVVICSGPSLQRTDLSLIRGLPYILVNRGHLLADSLDGHPAATCAHDPLVIAQFGRDLAVRQGPLVVPEQWRTTFASAEDPIFMYVGRRWRFGNRLGLEMHHGFTVTFWALHMAYHLGWSKTLIVGMDHNYGDARGPASGTRIVGGRDSDHFDPNYFPAGTKLLNGNLVASEYSYRLARAAFEADGREVVDCTDGGACQVFRKGDLAEEVTADQP